MALNAAEAGAGRGAWGIGVGLVVGTALLLTSQGRPLLKRTIIGCMAASDRVREITAEALEQVLDLYEEARADYQEMRDGGQGLESG